MKTAVPKAIAGRVFDYGMICSGEQSIIFHENDYDDIMAEFSFNNAYISENLTYMYLMNILRIARCISDNHVSSDE